jgi:hypothetical protein
LTEIYHLLGMKSSRDDLIDRMKTGWGCFVLASQLQELNSKTKASRKKTLKTIILCLCVVSST